MSGYLTTHVLDTARGCPAGGLKIELYRLESAETRVHLATMLTNGDGRTDAPILPKEDFELGEYELLFHVSDYFTQRSTPAFLSRVPIRFEMREDTHYHVPLLLSDYGYSTYRGS